MKQYILSDNAVKMIGVLRENTANVKASLCDVFSTVVFNAVSGTQEQKESSWQVLAAIQEYSHLIDSLTMSDSQIKNK